MSSNIIFPASTHPALTKALLECESIQEQGLADDADLQGMLLGLGLSVYQLRNTTGDLVVDKLEGHALNELIEKKALKLLTDFVESDDKEAPYLEFADDDGAPFMRWVMLADGSWKAYTPSLSWVGEDTYP